MSTLTGETDPRFEFVERFAALVAAAKQAECAKVCEAIADYTEEARASKVALESEARNDDETTQLRRMGHFMTVSTYNARIKKCVEAIEALGTP